MKSKYGFSLIELVLVMAIIGMLSTVVTFSLDVLHNPSNSDSFLEQNFNMISKLSLTKRKPIGWYASNSKQELYQLNSRGEKKIKLDSSEIDLYWEKYQDYNIQIKNFSGDIVVLDERLYQDPLIVFYPTGHISEAIINLKLDLFEISYLVNHNGIQVFNDGSK